METPIRDIKMVAVDMDGTFLHSDNTYDEPRFRRVLDRMRTTGCRFVVASGNQYWQLRDFFPEEADRISFVAENGAFIVDEGKVLFTAAIPHNNVEQVATWLHTHKITHAVMSGEFGAYIEQGCGQDFFDRMSIYYHRLSWTDDLLAVDDRILKFYIGVPDDETDAFVVRLKADLDGALTATASGHGDIDLIIPGCHKARGLERLAKSWGINASEVAAFGDAGNDLEMLRWAGHSYAMANADQIVRRTAHAVCPSNNEDGVLQTLESIFGI